MELKLQKILRNIDSVAIDTAPFIYYIEENKTYLKALDALFTLINDGKVIAYTSVITLIEVLTKPMEENNEELSKKYEDLLTNSEHLTLIDIDRDIAIETAKLRAKYKIKIPDAIQLAAGIVNNAGVFVTNDTNLKKVKEIKVIVLDDLIK
ncbi:MAG: PIN domain-containing protein [Proteobacteria bacterium]|nr:PIN domain-containing protein [Pseudomonadota bacterium]